MGGMRKGHVSTTRPDGWSEEDRPVGTGMIRTLYFKGQHSESCELTEDGWICDHRGCGVEDMKSIGGLTSIVDSLLRVDTDAERRHRFFGRVDWKIVRVSEQRKFFNGRSTEHPDHSIETWFDGTTWTKFGAKRAMNKALYTEISGGIPDRVRRGRNLS